VQAALEDLERDPTWQNPNVSALLGQFTGCHRYKKGDHRLIFKVAGRIVTVHVIANRRDVYR
jgi:mRNA-degrading endonuclease RelE of RelBE toxin-antitoxin system